MPGRWDTANRGLNKVGCVQDLLQAPAGRDGWGRRAEQDKLARFGMVVKVGKVDAGNGRNGVKKWACILQRGNDSIREKSTPANPD